MLSGPPEGRRTEIEAIRAAQALLERGERAALATVIRVRGSAPRLPGARMSVDRDGNIGGTVGGGGGELRTIEAALESIESGRPSILRIDMWATEKTAPGMVCGGSMDLLVEPLSPERDACWVEAVLGAAGGDRTVRVIRRLVEGGETECRVLLVEEAGGERLWADRESAPPPIPAGPGEGGYLFFGEPEEGGPFMAESIGPTDRLVIIGGGHVGAALCEIGALLSFEVTVLDERPETATVERFPRAAHLLPGDCREALRRIGGGEQLLLRSSRFQLRE